MKKNNKDENEKARNIICVVEKVIENHEIWPKSNSRK